MVRPHVSAHAGKLFVLGRKSASGRWTAAAWLSRMLVHFCKDAQACAWLCCRCDVRKALSCCDCGAWQCELFFLCTTCCRMCAPSCML
jgi:hypothetical protein